MIKPFNPEDGNIIERKVKESQSWHTELEQKYIHLFETYEGEETEKSYYKKGQILRGIECGKGWEKPVKQLLKALDFHLNKNCYIPNPDPDGEHKYIKDPNAYIKIFQIKEKFGEVRCYAQANSDGLQRLVDKCVAKLEARCELTCEGCGAVGLDFISSRSGWVVCLCSNCRENNSGSQLDFDYYLRMKEKEK